MRRRDVSGAAPTDALVSGLVATLVSGLVAYECFGYDRNWRCIPVAFTSWALTSQKSLVRSLSRLLLFEKSTHDRGCDHAAMHSIGAA